MRIASLFMIFLLFACSGTGDKGSSLGVSTGYEAGSENQDAPPAITFLKNTHDFGKVYHGEKLEFTFTFTNTGGSSLIIYSASASCGCTVPEYDKQPILPGEQGKIKIVFDTRGFRGAQSKSVNVYSNASNQNTILLVTAFIIV